MEKQLIILSLDIEEINLLMQALGELPAKLSMNLLSKVQTLTQEQIKQHQIMSSNQVEPEGIQEKKKIKPRSIEHKDNKKRKR